MDPSSLASVLGHLAQRAERQTQLQQAQNEVLVELARSLATDREAMRELLGSGERGGWCASCTECQLVNPPAIPRAPLRPLPLVEAPFDRVGMDIIGPLERSAQGYRFVLVLIDYATRYPEAIPLRNISAKSVAQALFHAYRGWKS